MKKSLYFLYFVFSFITTLAQPGQPDNTFNSNGKVLSYFLYDFGNGPESTGSDAASALLVQPDGKIIVGGSTYNGLNGDFALIRYNTNGTIDGSFGDNGYVRTDFGSGGIYHTESIVALALQTDGKIIALGTTITTSPLGDFAIVRYNNDGSPDSSFGTNGIVLADIGGIDQPTCLALQADGKIVVAGSSLNGSYLDFSLARYDTYGNLDSSFDGDGKLISSFSVRDDYLNAIAIQADGKIVVAGQTNVDFIGEFALARYNTDGSPDNSFDTDGKVVLSVGSSAETINGIALQTDGKIVVAGYGHNSASGNNDFMVARFLANGSPDNTFDGNGSAVTPVGPGHDYATSVVIQSNGEIVVAGNIVNSVLHDFAIVKYHANGALDNSFDTDGKLISDIGGDDFGNALALSGNRIYVVGSDNDIYNSGMTRIVIAAFQNADVVLPIQLLSFTASVQNTSVLLQWKTTAEQNTSHFIIEKSNDGTNFRSIGTVNAAGNSSTVKNYSFTDISMLTGTVFYRLKTIDMNGSFTYSKTVAVKQQLGGQQTILFPNPVKDVLYIQTNNINGPVILSIVDGTGRVVSKEKAEASVQSSFSFNVSSLAKGVYQFVLQSSNRREVLPFIKN
jgi:uncharacterized delta-60 repeat protein